MSRQIRSLQSFRLACAVACASVVWVAGCSNAVEQGRLLPTEPAAVVLLDLPPDYVAPGGPVPVAPWDLPADTVAAPVAADDSAALSIPAPVTAVEG